MTSRSGVEDYFLSKVTLEAAQLSIECVHPTTSAWRRRQVASANKLLLAQIARHRQAGSATSRCADLTCSTWKPARRRTSSSDLQGRSGVAGREGSGRRGGGERHACMDPRAGRRTRAERRARARLDGARRQAVSAVRAQLPQGAAGVGGERAGRGGGALRRLSDAAVVVERAGGAQRRGVDGDEEGQDGGDRRRGESAGA